MENKYYANYFNSINKGLIESKFSISNDETSPDLFFDTIK